MHPDDLKGLSDQLGQKAAKPYGYDLRVTKRDGTTEECHYAASSDAAAIRKGMMRRLAASVEILYRYDKEAYQRCYGVRRPRA